VKLEGIHSERPKNKPFLRLKTLLAAAFFGYLFFAVDHIYGINMEQLQLT